MIRIAIELIFTLVLALVVRVVLRSILEGIRKASANAFEQTAAEAQRRQSGSSDNGPAKTGTLHRDPVCGTFVPESTEYRRSDGGGVHYFCSVACRQAYTSAGH